MPVPDLTVAIIHHHLRGWPADCIESLMPLPAGTELLLVQSESARPPAVNLRVIRVRPEFSRAAARNMAVAQAQGGYLLLATSDTVAAHGTVERLRGFLEGTGKPVVASARLLQENGMPRRTGYAQPSIVRELNFLEWLRRQRFMSIHSRKPPVAGPAYRAAALHATFIMARRETFRTVGAFEEGYRFGYEDLEWSWRANRKGAELYVCPNAPAYKLSPQLSGELSPEVCEAMESSQQRCLRQTRGAGYAAAFRAVRATKSLAVWLGAAGLNSVLCGNSRRLSNQAAVHRAVWKMRDDATSGAELPDDVESCVRWEAFV